MSSRREDWVQASCSRLAGETVLARADRRMRVTRPSWTEGQKAVYTPL